MKSIFTAILLICFYSASSQDALYSDTAKESKNKIEKNGLPTGIRMIVITSDLNRDQLYQKTARLIIEQGFTLRASDPLIGILQSGHKKVRGGWWLKVTATVEENVVKITGLSADQRYGGRPLRNSGGNKHIFAFAAMDEFAKSIPHSKIEYLP